MKHGGDLTGAIARYGGAAEAWLDLSTGINPWSYPIQALPVQALPDHVWQRLPSRADEIAVCDAARMAYGVPDGVGIVAAAGTQALIQWLPRLAIDGRVAILGPTYGEHEAAWRQAGHDVVAIDRLDALAADTRHVVIVNPNNPDGRIVDREALARLATSLRARGGWLVIDEAFADVSEHISAVALCRDDPVVVLRSFGKFYGLAGIRLGFAIARADIANAVQNAIGPWACSGPALIVGARALRDHDWRDRMRERLARQADRLDHVLCQHGCAIVGGTTLYRLVRHRDATLIHAGLARQKIWCRRFEWDGGLLRFGLPPDQPALDRLAAALKQTGG
ncbi:MAG: aminotransferase [Tardiphaga sp.]|nr:aminotransferase [Tardiphaga sp.]